MYALAINTASSSTSILVLRKDQEQYLKISGSEWKNLNNQAEKIMPTIKELLTAEAIEFSHINEVFVISGPGSFTGLRVGISVANTLAYLLEAELFPITTFQYFHTLDPINPVIIFAGRLAVYLSKNIQSEPEIIPLKEINQNLASQSITKVTGDISPEQKTSLDVEYLQENINWQTDFTKVINQIRPELQSVKMVKAHYVKAPNIT